MNLRLAIWLFLLGSFPILPDASGATTFKLLNGRTLTGEPIAPDDRGLIIKTDETTFSERIGWTNFTEATILELAKDPQIKPHVEPFLFDLNDPEEEERKALVIRPKQVNRLARPDPSAGLRALFASPLSLALLLLIYAANVYAGFEIGIFRNYHPFMTAGIAAVLPVLGPIIFLSLPTNLHKSEEEYDEEEPALEEDLTEDALATAAAAEVEATATAVPKGPPPPTIYRRGQFTINKRFFETKLAPFTKPMPGAEDKDMVICIESARGNYIGNRIARIMPDELVLLVSKGGASTEVTLPFTEIKEVQVRHKDA